MTFLKRDSRIPALGQNVPRLDGKPNAEYAHERAQYLHGGEAWHNSLPQ